MEAAGQEVDHGRLAIPAPGEVADADDGDGQGAARAEPREEQGQAEDGGRGGEEGHGEDAVDEGEVPDGGVRGGGEAGDELSRLLLHPRPRSAAARRPEKGELVVPPPGRQVGPFLAYGLASGWALRQRAHNLSQLKNSHPKKMKNIAVKKMNRSFFPPKFFFEKIFSSSKVDVSFSWSQSLRRDLFSFS